MSLPVTGISKFIEQPFDLVTFPLGQWVETFVEWLVENYRPFFISIKVPIDWFLGLIEGMLHQANPIFIIFLFFLLAWQMLGIKGGFLVSVALFFIGSMQAWDQAMTTIAVVCTSVVFCSLIGIPVGIMMAKSDRADKILKPVLDAMQTTPAFSYLVPVVMLFGVGKVPGTIVTIIFATAPLIRLTNLGIRNVRPDVIEAAVAFGASDRQLLFKVQLPLASWTIMAGFNQALMLSLAMSVIAAMIAVGGLGQLVLRGIGRLDIGLAVEGAVCIVLLAVCLDRITQAMSSRNDSGGKTPTDPKSPIGLVRRLLGKQSSI